MPEARIPGVPARFAVASIVEVELNQPLSAITVPGEHDVLVVVSLCGAPLGMLMRSAGELESASDLAAAINSDLRDALREELPEHGLPGTAPVVTEAGMIHAECPLRARYEAAAGAGQGISVVICTRDRSASLARCLESVRHSAYGVYEIVVVDNAPKTDATAVLCEQFVVDNPGVDIRYELEPRPGLSRARNSGISAARYDLIAFVDDDERVDSNWLTALSIELSSDSLVGCVSGIVLPAELATEAQVGFEQFGGHSKGRGFRRVCFDSRYLHDRQSPMYPLPPFGVGANMAFRRDALESIGGFDLALGAGTRSRACEDTLAFSEVLLAGRNMVYAPRAVTWHYHRADDEALVDQLTSYGVGLGAYYTALVMRDPRRIVPLARMLPRAVRDLTDPQSARNASLQGLPATVAQANVRQIAKGPFIYVRERLRASRSQTLRPSASS